MLDQNLRDGEAPDRSLEPFASQSLAPAWTAGAIVAIVRLFVSRSRTTFSIWPDEPAQLAMARLLGGGTRWDMHDHSTWRPGYALLLSPVYWFTDDATTVFRSAMAINAVLGAIAVVVLVFLTRRLTNLSPWAAALAATVVMSMPAMLFPTDFVWSESLVVALFLAALLALIRFDEAATVRRGCVAAAVVTASFAAHSRMLPLFIVFLAVVAMAVARNGMARRNAIACVALVLAGGVVVQFATRTIVERLWRDPAGTNTVGAATERLVDVGPLVVSAAGQWWYLVVSSAGLVGFGVWGLARRIRDREPAKRRSAVIVAASTLGCVVLSVAFMSARDRPDRIVYGRYNDAVIAPILVIGIAVLIGAVGRRHLVAATGIIGCSLLTAGAVLVAFRREPLAADNGVEPMILGLQPFIGRSTSIDVVPITIAAAALLVAIGAVASMHDRGPRWRSVTWLLVGSLIVVGGVRTGDAIDRGWNDVRDDQQLVALGDGPLAGGEPVDFYVPPASDDTRALMSYQFALSDNEFTVVEDLGSGTARFVVAPSDATWPTDRPVRLVWDDPTRPISLWERVTRRR